MEEPDNDDHDYEERDQYDEDKERYEDKLRNPVATTSLLHSTGAIVLSAGLLQWIFLDKDLSPKTKFGMPIAIGLISGPIFSPGVRTEDLLING